MRKTKRGPPLVHRPSAPVDDPLLSLDTAERIEEYLFSNFRIYSKSLKLVYNKIKNLKLSKNFKFVLISLLTESTPSPDSFLLVRLLVKQFPGEPIEWEDSVSDELILMEIAAGGKSDRLKLLVNRVIAFGEGTVA